MAFDEDHAVASAKEIIRLAIDTFKERKGKEVFIPQHKNKVVAGFSFESMMEILAALMLKFPCKL